MRNDQTFVLGQSKPLPQKEGDMDWDLISERYHDYILSPFAPEMVRPDERGIIRNTLLQDLLNRPAENALQVETADFGCGPGNLILHLKGRVKTFTGVDKSPGALKIASAQAEMHGLDFRMYCGDLRTLSLGKTFDLIFSVNAILPQSRSDVLRILKNIHAHLKPEGLVMAIPPSFDTTIYLKSLLYDHYCASMKDRREAERLVQRFVQDRRVREESCSYADDGRTSQCYHTPETIDREFRSAGFRVLHGPQKIYYPWALTRRFDYGYFPQAREEIWDWYVVAGHKDSQDGPGHPLGGLYYKNK